MKIIPVSSPNPWNKVLRADEHFQTLNKEIKTVTDPKSYPTTHEFNTETGQHIWKLADDPPNLGKLSPIIGDGVHNLRCALDHLVHRLIIRNGQTLNTRSEFPIFDSEVEYNNGSGRKLRGVSDAARDIIKTLKPYKGGNDGLWLLHHLDIIDKHRYFNIVILNLTKFGAQKVPLNASNAIEIGMPFLTSGSFGKDTVVYTMTGYRGDPQKVQMQSELTFQVAFNEPELGLTEQVMPVVNFIMESVDNVFKTIPPHFI